MPITTFYKSNSTIMKCSLDLFDRVISTRHYFVYSLNTNHGGRADMSAMSERLDGPSEHCAGPSD